MKRRVVEAIIALLALVFGATGAMAQTATGQITGEVRDGTGAVLAKARVKVDSALTGITRETTTNVEGTYVFPLLPVGVYTVTVEQQGFRAARKVNITINVDQIVRADFDLTVGEVSAVVEVESGAVALDSETASIGQVVSQRQVNDLPLNGRNFLQLLFIGAGAVETAGEQGTMRQGAGNAISINGSRPTSNNYMLDGTSNTDTALGTPAVILSVDAIQEFKEQTATYSAEYGFSANQVNIVSKTGTNNLHGTAVLVRAQRRARRQRLLQQSGWKSEIEACARINSALLPAARSGFRSSTTGATRLSGLSTMKERAFAGASRALTTSQLRTNWLAGSQPPSLTR